MSTDAPDTPPPIGPSVEEQARGQAAYDRPHPRAPIHDSPHLDGLDDSLYHAFTRARELFRIRAGRNPADDVEYSHLKPHLITLAGRWSRALQDDPTDDELADLLSEIRHYLPKHDRGAPEATPTGGIAMRSIMRVEWVEHFPTLGRDILGLRAIGLDHCLADHVDLTMTVVNPCLVGMFRRGQAFDVCITESSPPHGGGVD